MPACTAHRRPDSEKQTHSKEMAIVREIGVKEATKDGHHQGQPRGMLGKREKGSGLLCVQTKVSCGVR